MTVSMKYYSLVCDESVASFHRHLNEVLRGDDIYGTLVSGRRRNNSVMANEESDRILSTLQP